MHESCRATRQPLWENDCTRVPGAWRGICAVNLPNSITLTRIASVPLLIWALSPHFPQHGFSGEQEVFASALFILASITDGVDGYLARKRGQITTLGMLLDPLADKLMVTSAFILLVAYNPSVMKPWIAVLVIGREFLVSGLRSIATSEGFTIQASDLGKLKTVIQIVAVVAAILNHRWYEWDLGPLVIGVHLIAVIATYWMTVVSIISAADYFIGFWKKVDHASGRTRRRSAVLTRRKKPAPPTALESTTKQKA
jgi:CDP-diacylglycerol--glycerol-3-phosphate 3-phosphatidyltransferase